MRGKGRLVGDQLLGEAGDVGFAHTSPPADDRKEQAWKTHQHGGKRGGGKDDKGV